jgi:hypothetical protein
VVNGQAGQIIYPFIYNPIAIPAPLSGGYLAWLGGKPNRSDALRQTLSLPAGYGVKLQYYYQIASQESNCNNDYATVYVNTIEMVRYTLCKSSKTYVWQPFTIDLNNFRGAIATFSFETHLNDSLNSNFFLENVQICSSDPAAPADMPPCNTQ